MVELNSSANVVAMLNRFFRTPIFRFHLYGSFYLLILHCRNKRLGQLTAEHLPSFSDSQLIQVGFMVILLCCWVCATYGKVSSIHPETLLINVQTKLCAGMLFPAMPCLAVFTIPCHIVRRRDVPFTLPCPFLKPVLLSGRSFPSRRACALYLIRCTAHASFQTILFKSLLLKEPQGLVIPLSTMK